MSRVHWLLVSIVAGVLVLVPPNRLQTRWICGLIESSEDRIQDVLPGCRLAQVKKSRFLVCEAGLLDLGSGVMFLAFAPEPADVPRAASGMFLFY